MQLPEGKPTKPRAFPIYNFIEISKFGHSRSYYKKCSREGPKRGRAARLFRFFCLFFFCFQSVQSAWTMHERRAYEQQQFISHVHLHPVVALSPFGSVEYHLQQSQRNQILEQIDNRHMHKQILHSPRHSSGMVKNVAARLASFLMEQRQCGGAFVS